MYLGPRTIHTAGDWFSIGLFAVEWAHWHALAKCAVLNVRMQVYTKMQAMWETRPLWVRHAPMRAPR